MADFEDLDWAFTCPASVTDEDLRGGYEVLVARFRSEGEHLPLNTAFQLVIERAITTYIKHKFSERREYGDTGGFADPRQEKDSNALVRDMLHEVSDMLRKNHPNADRELVLAEVKEIILGVMRGLSDTSVRDDLARRFAVAFERSGF